MSTTCGWALLDALDRGCAVADRADDLDAITAG